MTLNAAQKDNLKFLQTTLITSLNRQIEAMRNRYPDEKTKNHQVRDVATILHCSALNLKYIEKNTLDGAELDRWVVFSHLGLLLYYESNKNFSLYALMGTIKILWEAGTPNIMTGPTITDIINYRIQPQIGERYPEDFEKWVRALSIQLKSR